MFQNINSEESQEEKKEKNKINLKNLLTINDIILYVVSFMVSMVGFDDNFAPFGLAMFSAACSNRIPAGLIYFFVLVRYIN